MINTPGRHNISRLKIVLDNCIIWSIQVPNFKTIPHLFSSFHLGSVAFGLFDVF